jgi:hypothetical protein
MYPRDPDHPTNTEFDQMVELMTKQPALKDTSIYPVRGNHDCRFKWYEEFELSKLYKNWKFNNFFDAQLFKINQNS